LAAVESGNIALNAALDIARGGNDDKAIQAALQEAYESGQLRGKQLIRAKKLVQQRRTLGRSIARSGPRKTSDVSSISLVLSYQKEVERQKLFIKKAEFTQRRLLFIVSALRNLFGDEHFATLLRAEGLDDLPAYLAERVWPEGQPA
jgi:ParB family chromosome partitioning protein